MTDHVTPRVDRLAILLLSAEWIFFGSLHFTFHDLTKAEIPGFIPSKSFIVVITGVAEVVTGILILLPKCRKWAALASLVLLVIFIPAIFKMLAIEAANPGNDGWRNVWRVLLVPNHVIMALSAIHLWQSKSTSTIGPAQILESAMDSPRVQIANAPALIVASVMLLANLAGFLVIVTSPWYVTTSSLWAMMCLATGALVGFLFGVPRINSKTVKTRVYVPNSNIVAISDWLTKIIVGVGLVEFRNIGTFLSSVSAELGKSLPKETSLRLELEATSFAQALIVYFFAAGVIQGYLLTRMYLSEKFQDIEATRTPANAISVNASPPG